MGDGNNWKVKHKTCVLSAIPTLFTNFALHFHSVELNMLLQENGKAIPQVYKNTSWS